ncbi:MAG: hypothetical protein AMXMBFR58_36390 [Phycisphaerae bacterium]
MIKGRRDEMARQAIVSYVDEIVINPGQKTAVMTVNAGFGSLDGGPAAKNGNGGSHNATGPH